MNQNDRVDFVHSPANLFGAQHGFVPCPLAILSGMTQEQLQQQQEIYQRAYAEAWASVGVQVLKLPVFGREWRN